MKLPKLFKVTVCILIVTLSIGLAAAYSPIHIARKIDMRDDTLTGAKRSRQQEKAAFDEYYPYVNEIYHTVAQEVEQKMGLVFCGTRGQMHEKLEELGMQFTAYRRATLEEARALLLAITQKMVQAVNAHEKLTPFLDERPFTHNRVCASISFEGLNGSYADGTVYYMYNISNLASAVENRNKIFYHLKNPLTGHLIKFFRESFDHAFKHVPPDWIENPPPHQSSPLEEAWDDVLYHFRTEMAEKYGLECWHIGGKIGERVEEIGALFKVVDHAWPDEARQWMVQTVGHLLSIVNASEKLRPYLAEYPFPLSRIALEIAFIKEGGYSYGDGIKKVVLNDSCLLYSQETGFSSSPPTNRKISALEPYEKALTRVHD